MKKTLLVLAVLALALLFSRSAEAVLDTDFAGELVKEVDTKVVTSNGNPFEFPYTGKTFNQRVEWQGLATGGSLSMLNKPTGTSGLVRNVQVILQMPNVRTNAEHIRLNISYDGSPTPSVTVPVTSLIGYETGEALVAGAFTTPFFSVTTPALNNNQDLGFVLRYPVPYTNGIQMFLDTDGTPGLAATVWTNTFYQDSLPNVWNRNLRLFITRSDENVPGEVPKAGTVTVNPSDGHVTGSAATNFQQDWVGKYLNTNSDLRILSVQDSHNLMVNPSDVLGLIVNAGYSIAESHTFLDRPNEAGWIAAVYAGFAPSEPDFSYLEGNVRFFVDSETSPSLQWSGTEDFFGNAFYFESKSQDDTGGVVSYDDSATFKITAYRLFSDHPIRYTRGIRAVWPNFFDAVQTNWTTVLYREM